MIQQNDDDWIHKNVFDCAFPNIDLLNAILHIPGHEAEMLSSEQIMKLVSLTSDDPNVGWLYTMDVNLFKHLALDGFQKLNMPLLNEKKWAVFCINDALLTDSERIQSRQTNVFHGSHWFTAAVWID